jgi:hypothetical protein
MWTLHFALPNVRTLLGLCTISDMPQTMDIMPHNNCSSLIQETQFFFINILGIFILHSTVQ